MSLISSILAPFKWLGKIIASGIKTEAPIAVTITEAIKTILANPVTGFLENMIDSVTGTNIAVDAANAVNAIIPRILAAELAVEGLPINPTGADILAFEQRVLAAFDIKSNNSRLYTTLGAQIYGILQASPDTKFFTLVYDIEQAYADYQKDIADNGEVAVKVAPVVTPTPIVTETAQEQVDPNEQ